MILRSYRKLLKNCCNFNRMFCLYGSCSCATYKNTNATFNYVPRKSQPNCDRFWARKKLRPTALTTRRLRHHQNAADTLRAIWTTTTILSLVTRPDETMPRSNFWIDHCCRRALSRPKLTCRMCLWLWSRRTSIRRHCDLVFWGSVLWAVAL